MKSFSKHLKNNAVLRAEMKTHILKPIFDKSLMGLFETKIAIMNCLKYPKMMLNKRMEEEVEEIYNKDLIIFEYKNNFERPMVHEQEETKMIPFAIKNFSLNCFNSSLDQLILNQQKLGFDCPVPISLYNLASEILNNNSLHFNSAQFFSSETEKEGNSLIEKFASGDYCINENEYNSPHVAHYVFNQILYHLNYKESFLKT